jgi:hypothetical protein
MPKMQRPAGSAAIEVEIERIRSLGVDELRTLYRTTFRSAPPKALTKDLIGRMIAWRIQEQAYGGLDRATRKLLNDYARGQTGTADGTRRLKPGTVLVREYQGERHTVTVVRDGFVWRGKTYGSLSGIARAITGMTWNGPRFFGLRVPRDSRERDAPPVAAARSTPGRPSGRSPRKRPVRSAEPTP